MLACAPTVRPAAADGDNFAQAINRTAYFFAEKDESTSLFAVPYTYCVRIVRDEGAWYYASYAEDEGIYRRLYGYVLKSDFEIVAAPPENVYLSKLINITYSADGADPSLPSLGEIEMEAAFYGTYYSGATAYSYVLCGDSFGYIAGANDDYALNELLKDGQDAPPAEENDGGAVAAAVIIIALAGGALIVLFLSSRKRKGG